MSKTYEESWLKKRKKYYEAESALLGFTEFLSENMPAQLKGGKNKIYFYCNMQCLAMPFYAFYTEGEKAFDLRDVLDKREYKKFKAKAVKRLRSIQMCYLHWPSKVPVELLLVFDPAMDDVSIFKTNDRYTSVYDAANRFKAWFEEHGGQTNREKQETYSLKERVLRKLFKAGDEETKTPTLDAEKINIKALEAKRRSLKNLGSPSAMFVPLVAIEHLDGDSGFLAIKDAFDERYPDNESPYFYYYDQLEHAIMQYNFFFKRYRYMLYDYIAMYEDSDSWHVLSFGMSDISDGYVEEGLHHINYHAEYTMRIKKYSDQKLDDAESLNAAVMVSMLADEAITENRMLEAYTYISLGHEEGMDYKRESDKVAFIIVPDARISSIDGPFGTVYMRQAVPITRAEYNALEAKKIDVNTLYEKIGSDLVDYDRPSVI